MTEKIIALVDYENVGTLENITLARYERLLLFTGAQQDFIRLPAVTQAGNITVSVLQAPGVYLSVITSGLRWGLRQIW